MLQTLRPRHLFKDGQADVFFGLREVLELRHEELEKNTEVAKWP